MSNRPRARSRYAHDTEAQGRRARASPMHSHRRAISDKSRQPCRQSSRIWLRRWKRVPRREPRPADVASRADLRALAAFALACGWFFVSNRLCALCVKATQHEKCDGRAASCASQRLTWLTGARVSRWWRVHDAHSSRATGPRRRTLCFPHAVFFLTLFFFFLDSVFFCPRSTTPEFVSPNSAFFFPRLGPVSRLRPY